MIKTISFTLEYTKEYQHLLKQDNASKYICKLIRNDMEGNSSESIRFIIKEVLAEVMGSSVPSKPSCTDSLNDIVDDLLK